MRVVAAARRWPGRSTLKGYTDRGDSDIDLHPIYLVPYPLGGAFAIHPMPHQPALWFGEY